MLRLLELAAKWHGASVLVLTIRGYTYNGSVIDKRSRSCV